MSEDSVKTAKHNFLTKMSHEIRTPLNTVIGLTELAKDKTADPVYIQQCLEKIANSSKYLLELIDDVLDISSMENGNIRLHISSVNFKDFIDEIIGEVRSQTNAKKVVFNTRIEGTPALGYSFDVNRLKQVLLSILGNAVKFTPRYGSVDFIVRKLDSTANGDKIEFIIRDTGVGIDEEFLPHVFEAFEQEYSGNTTVYGGTGLGMALSYNIIKLMGGNIIVDSEKAKGTEFSVELTLPVDNNVQEEKPQPKKDSYDFTGRRVLLAEDNEINCEIAVQMLKRRGMDVDVAENGREALSHYMMNPPNAFDLVIMDVRMPYMDGLTATKKIRNSGKTDCKTIPIIAMTANATDEDMELSKEAGMNAHLTKPIMPNVLYSAIQSALNGTLSF